MMMNHPALTGITCVSHGFFTRAGGVSQGLYASLNCGLGSEDRPEAVAENRSRVAQALGTAPDLLLTAWQVHSAEALVVEGPWPGGTRARVDGLATRTPGLALGILTADCGPLLFADAEARVIGACHAGWQGALGGVTAATLDAMERLGAARRRIVAVIGPTISEAAYETGPEFIGRFTARDPGHARFFSAPGPAGHRMFDLPGFIAARLAAEGVGAVHDLGHCTYADDARFFSYRRTTHRREPDYGRQISAIMLTD